MQIGADGDGSKRLCVNDEKHQTAVATLSASPRLHANVPNPFNPQTTIRFDLLRPEHVRLFIHAIDGRRIATLVDESRSVGTYSVTWNGLDDRSRPVASGTYFYRLEAGEFTQTESMILLK